MTLATTYSWRFDSSLATELPGAAADAEHDLLLRFSWRSLSVLVREIVKAVFLKSLNSPSRCALCSCLLYIFDAPPELLQALHLRLEASGTEANTTSHILVYKYIPGPSYKTAQIHIPKLYM